MRVIENQEGEEDFRSLFFDTNISQILKAMDGKAFLAAFTLGMCSIGALSSLENASASDLSEEGDGKSFRRWVSKWMRVYDHYNRPPYPGEYLYGVRCALVHTFGGAKALEKIELPTYSLTFDRPNQHMKEMFKDEYHSGYVINLECFISDLIVAAWEFWTTLSPDQEQQVAFNLECRKLVSLVDDPMTPSCRLRTRNQQYSQLHPALATFDDTKPSYNAIKQSIHSIYIRTGACRC